MELNALGRKVQQLEETFENTEEKLKSANDSLVQVAHAGDESERYDELKTINLFSTSPLKCPVHLREKLCFL